MICNLEDTHHGDQLLQNLINRQPMKKITLQLLAISALLHLPVMAITTVSATGGTYTISNSDSTVLGQIDVQNGYEDFYNAAAGAQYDLSGLDFANYSYTYDLSASARTGRSNVTLSSDNVVGVLINADGWDVAYTSYDISTGYALTDSYVQLYSSDAAHIEDVTLTIYATAIPEPSSAVLLSLGAFSLLAKRRRS